MQFKHIFTILIGMMLVVTAYGRNITVVYIAHDVDTPVEKLMSKLERYHDKIGADDEDMNNRTIFYMSSGSNPIVADMKSGDTDEDNYERVMREFERNYHDVDGEYDAERFIDLFANDDFLSSLGELDVNDMTFEFYVTPSFWSTNNNQKFLATLFYSLGLERFTDPKSPQFTRDLNFTVFFPSMEDVRLCKGQENKPFGDRNLNNINSIIGTTGFIGSYD